MGRIPSHRRPLSRVLYSTVQYSSASQKSIRPVEQVHSHSDFHTGVSRMLLAAIRASCQKRSRVMTISALPPDLVIVTTSLILLQVSDLFLRLLCQRLISTYPTLPAVDRYTWDRRILNLVFQVLQFPFNLYLLVSPSPITDDPLYGYSSLAHMGFLVILSFYLYDAIGLVIHPKHPSSTPLWIFHHLLAVSLLLFDVSYRRSSAFPAATFLISAAGHVANEVRWLMIVVEVRDPRAWKLVHALCVSICFITCALPPPYLLVKAARYLDVSLLVLLTHKMRIYCNFFFALIYIPHVGLCFYQLYRAYCAWGQPPRPFRRSKIH